MLFLIFHLSFVTQYIPFLYSDSLIGIFNFAKIYRKVPSAYQNQYYVARKKNNTLRYAENAHDFNLGDDFMILITLSLKSVCTKR